MVKESPSARFLDVASIILLVAAALYFAGISFTFGQYKGLGLHNVLLETQDSYGLIATGVLALIGYILDETFYSIMFVVPMMSISTIPLIFKKVQPVIMYLLSLFYIVLAVYVAGHNQGLNLGKIQLNKAKAVSLVKDSESGKAFLPTRVTYIDADGKPKSIYGSYLTSTLRFSIYYVEGDVLSIKTDRIISVKYRANSNA
jgi:hypothetical protein